MKKLLIGGAITFSIVASLVGIYVFICVRIEKGMEESKSITSRLNALKRREGGTTPEAVKNAIGSGAARSKNINIGEGAIFYSPHDRPFPLPLQKYRAAYDKCMDATDMPALENMIAQKQVFRVPNRSYVSKVTEIDDASSLIRVISVPSDKINDAVGHLVVAPNECLVRGTFSSEKE